MSAFLAFVGGAAGEWNQMNEEARAAKAAQIKADKELAAKIAQEERDWKRWQNEQKAIADREDEVTRDERQYKNTQRAEQTNRLVPELLSKQNLLPNQFHFLTYGTESGMPKIESVDKPVEGYTFTEGQNIAKTYNAQVKDQGIFYALEPLKDNPERFTLTIRDINKDNEKEFLFDSQEDAQDAAAAETQRLQDSGADNLRAVALPVTDGTGWTYKIEKTGDKKDTKPTVPADDYGIEYNANYYFRKSPKFGEETGKIAQSKGGQILNLTPGLNLPMSGEGMANYQEDVNYLVMRRAMGPDGNVVSASQDMTFFFDDFTPEIAERIIYSKNEPNMGRTYALFTARLQEVLTNYTLNTADEIPDGRQLMPLPEEYAARLNELAEIDPNIRRILQNSPNDETVAEINRTVGNPVNEPIPAAGTGGTTVLRNQNFADAFAVERDGRSVYPEDVQGRVNALAINSQSEPSYIHRFFNQAVDTNGQPSVEATQGAFSGTEENKELLAGYRFKTVRGGRAQYTMPSVLEVDQIQDNLTYFRTDTQRIDALAIALPPLAVRQAHASAQVAANAGPAALYESVTGNTDYAKLQDKLTNAQRIMSIDSELQTLLGPLQGEVSVANQITLLKKGADYLLESVMPTIVGGAGVDMTAEQSQLRGQLEEALSETDEAAQVAALVRLNTKMQAYAYAAMMDPNGRLSDQDREQATIATGSEGLTATKDTVLAVSARLSSSAQRVAATINGYRSNDPRRVVATHLYSTQIAGGMPTTVVEFLAINAAEAEAETTTRTQTEVQSNVDIINQSLGIISAPAQPEAPVVQQNGTQETPPAPPRPNIERL